MRRTLITLLLFAMMVSLGATVSSKTYLSKYQKQTDSGLNATPADAYATSIDAVISDKFPAALLNDRIVVANAYIKEAANGTSADHLTPVIQVSGDGTYWSDLMILEAYSSSVVSAEATWTYVIDLRGVFVPYVRIAYIIHTAAHATLADASTGDIRTIIYTLAK